MGVGKVHLASSSRFEAVKRHHQRSAFGFWFGSVREVEFLGLIPFALGQEVLVYSKGWTKSDETLLHRVKT
jgi:hypothetical protein